MLARQYRFHGHNSLRSVYQHGRSVRSQLLIIKYARNDRRAHFRVAVVVSRKISKSAVVRNRIRRRIYEQLRLSQIGITHPYDIVITVTDERAATMPANELANMLRQQLTKAGILTKPPLQSREPA